LKTILNIIVHFKILLVNQILLARLKRKHPTCHFYPGACVEGHSSLGKYIVLFQNAAIVDSSIGDFTFIQKESVINHADVGRFCSIAKNVNIGLGQHPTSHVSSHPAFYSSTQPIAKTFSRADRFKPFRRTEVGHDVWIGQNALLMDGIKVKNGAIVAAGAVVTKDVPAYALVAGVPAKIIKYRFDDDIRKRILETEWWNMPENWLQLNYTLFSDPLKFLDVWGKIKNKEK
jgi:acetyltransferase-like isoleucine patch superfamily enzyme